MRRQVEDIQTLNGWLQAMLRQDPGPLVELHSAKRFEGHFVTEITPDHEVGDLEAALERTLTWWIHCSAQWSTLKFYSGAEELVLHLRTKIRVLIQICIGLNHACKKRWIAAVQRGQLLSEIFYPMIYGSIDQSRCLFHCARPIHFQFFDVLFSFPAFFTGRWFTNTQLFQEQLRKNRLCDYGTIVAEMIVV
jgi:hypothetical protein